MCKQYCWNIGKYCFGNVRMELFEEEIEIYNSKMRLLNWLYDELRVHSEGFRDLINEKGQKLPLNL